MVRPVRSAGAAVLGLVVVLGLAACGSDDPGPTPTVTADAPDAATDKSAPPTPVEDVVWPLTGVETKKVADRPALAVKIENSLAARPQTGLEDADMVWEEVVEGGITRFVVVFQSKQPETIGPIRSVRPMDPSIVAPLGGPLVYSGAQKPFIDAVTAAGIQSVMMDAGDPGFYRSSDRYAPHNVYGASKDFWVQADDDHDSPPPQQFQFARTAAKSSAAAGGTAATTLTATLSVAQRSVWTWDKSSGAYQRSDGATPAVSAAGERLAATNVVVLAVDVANTSYKDPSGAPVPETKLTGSGKALVLSGGKAVTATWSKKDVGSVMTLQDADGDPVLLAPGNTWVELVPDGTGSYTTE